MEKPIKPEETNELTNPNKILYPEQGITKLNLANYYAEINKWILPFIINRPLTLVRCPNGYQKQCFYQKHLIHKTPNLYGIKINRGEEPYFYIKDIKGLLAIVQMGVLEIHPWGSKIDNIEKPDHIIFDLDPAPDVNWSKVVKAALLVRDELLKLNLISFVKTTGGKGLHVYIPIKRQYSWEEVKLFTHTFVNYLVSLRPNEFIGVMTKSKRKGKIFIDYLRNQRGATAVAAYSTRSKNGAPVSTPLAWDELSARVKSDFYTLENIPHRLEKLKKDPWKDFFKLKQTLKMK